MMRGEGKYDGHGASGLTFFCHFTSEEVAKAGAQLIGDLFNKDFNPISDITAGGEN